MPITYRDHGSGANYFSVASTTTFRASDDTHTQRWIGRLGALGVGHDRYLFAKGSASSGGWCLYVNSSNEIRGRYSGTETPAFTVTDANAWLDVVGVLNPDGVDDKIHLYVNGVLVGSTAKTSHTKNTTTTRIGRSSTTDDGTSLQTAGCAWSFGVASAEDVAAEHAALRASGALNDSGSPVNWYYIYQIGQSDLGDDDDAGSWPDTGTGGAGETMTEVGTVIAEAVDENPTWHPTS